MAILILHLMGTAQQAMDTMQAKDLTDYNKLREAILQTLNRSPEACWRWLWDFILNPATPSYHPEDRGELPLLVAPDLAYCQ